MTPEDFTLAALAICEATENPEEREAAIRWLHAKHQAFEKQQGTQEAPE